MATIKKSPQAKKSSSTTFDEFLQLLKRLKEGIVEPFYVLQGEEDFFKEQIIKEVAEYTIPTGSRAFNYFEFIADRTSANEIFKNANRNRLGEAEYTLTVIRGAEAIDDWELVQQLFEYPKEKGIIVLEFQKLTPKKKGQETSFKSILTIVQNKGLIFNSVPMYESQVRKVVEYIANTNGCKIQSEASDRLIALFGGALSAIDNEIRKIAATLAKGESISLDSIKELKPYREYTANNLTSAIVEGDLNKALTIIFYMAANRNTNNVIGLNSSLYFYFQKIFLWGVLQRNRPTNELVRILGIREIYKDEYMKAATLFPPQRCSRIIARLREIDLQLKGVGSAGATPYEQMKQILLNIISA